MKITMTNQFQKINKPDRYAGIFTFLLPGLISLLLSFQAHAQTRITGKVTDTRGEPLIGANVLIKDSYDGTSSGAEGVFNFTTSETGAKVLQVLILGYETYEQPVQLDGKEINLNIKLKEKVNELNAVTISAGSFEASDEKKAVILSPLDIVTTASAAGDIYGALQTLPGTQTIGETEGLFVRGGSATEAKTVIDGMDVPHPYFSSVPDIAQRGRFNPFLFKGTFFSTGGYSAEYGQAMSSALLLKTQDMPDKSLSHVGISVVGIGGGHEHRWKNTSLGLSANYINLAPYFNIAKQRTDWVKDPQNIGTELTFRQKTSKTGMIKTFGYFNASQVSLNRDDISSGQRNLFELDNRNTYINTSYKELIRNKYTLYTGIAYGRNEDRIQIDTTKITADDEHIQVRSTLSRQIGRLSDIKIGGETGHADYTSSFNQFTRDNEENLSAGFIESNIYLTDKLVTRVGARTEHSTLIGKTNYAPRASLAYKTSDDGQVSLAYGQFFQTPSQLYVTPQTADLDFEKASHYIVNYQIITDKRTFRIEPYYKVYENLIRTAPDTNVSGTGYAKGIDIFWRDKKTIKYVDYWISYSYLDSKRQYLDYPMETVPTFASKHTLSLVYKQYIPKLTSNIGASYTFATGRPYFNPNNPVFLGDRTNDYHNLSLNFNYLTTIRDNFTVFVLAVSNVLGFDNIYGYNYSPDGKTRNAVQAPNKRFIFAGMFITIGTDEFND